MSGRRGDGSGSEAGEWSTGWAEALVTAVDLAESAAERAGRAVVGPALDLDDTARHLEWAWTGHAAEAAGRALTGAAARVDALSGPLLVLADVLRVEGSALARTLLCGGDSTELAEADEALGARIAEVAAALLGVERPEAAPVLPTDPRERARAWHSLGPADRAAALAGEGAAPADIPLDGLTAAERDAHNRRRLDDLRDSGDHPEVFEALARHLAADPGRMLLALADDGRAVVAEGNPDRAARVVTFVPGTGSSPGSIELTAGRAESVCAEAVRDDPPVGARRDGVPGDPHTEPCVAVAWQGYDAPDTVPEAAVSPHLARAHAPELASLAAGLDAVDLLDGTDAPHTVVGYSFGSVVVGEAAASPGGLAADRMLHVGSPGFGTGTVAEQRVDEGGVPRTATDREVVGLRSRWDPVPWWSLTGVLGGDPGSDAAGGRRVDAEPGLPLAERHRTHSHYFTPGSPSLAAIGEQVVDP